MIQRTPISRKWHEPLRIGLTVVWVATLTLWVYYPILFLYSASNLLGDALGNASTLLKTVVPLWFACFFPGLAFGLAWYGFTKRPDADLGRNPIQCGMERRAGAQRIMILCTASSLFLLNWRLLPFEPMVGAHQDNRLSQSLFEFYWAAEGGLHWAPTLEHFATIGLLGCGLIFLQLWGLVGPFEKGRRNVTVLAASLFAAGVLIPWSGLLQELPMPLNSSVFKLDLAKPALRNLLLDDNHHKEAGQLVLDRYFRTHDDKGTPATYHEIQKESLAGWDWSRQDIEYSFALCELCRLPGIGGWTINGIGLLLGDDRTPESTEPTQVVEIPRRGNTSRVYNPRDPATFVSGSIQSIPSQLGDSDWIILKIDLVVPMDTVMEILTTLRDHGIRRVDLAVIPHGFVPIPPNPVRVVLGGQESKPQYIPRIRDQKQKAIVVKKYRPAPPGGFSQQVCSGVGRLEYYFAWSDLIPESPDTLPARVSIRYLRDQTYGEFIGRFQGAIMGGATRIDLVLTK